jgi:PAS domain S-box-containing protein
MLLRPDHSIVWLNPAAARIAGKPEADLLGRKCHEVFHGADCSGPPQFCPMERDLFTGRPELVSLDMKIADRWYGVTCAPIFDGRGRLDKIVHIAADITQAKSAEAALRESEEKYRLLFEMESDALFLIEDDSGRIVEANPAAALLYGYNRDELLGMRNTELSAQPEETRRASLGSTTRIPVRYHRRKDGTVFPVEITAGRLIWKERPSHLPAIRDISERLRAEEDLRTSLAEKEILLREIHHRVRNNMQIISSLLRLQAIAVDNQTVHEVFQVIQGRIQTMETIYAMLTRSPDLTRIGMAEFLTRLTANIQTLFNRTEGGIEFRIAVKAITLDIPRANACGLIVNELATNAFKHAFPEGRAGTISIAMTIDETGKHVLAIKDNGVGIPEDFDFRMADSLGMQIVVGMVDKLDGTVELFREGGTEFRIVF